MTHIPVLENEVIKILDAKANENFIDCTIGEGGHTFSILENNTPQGKVLGIEIDPELFEKLKKEHLKRNLKERLVLVNDSYRNLREIIQRKGFANVQGILFDLGMSSWHLEKSKRGFSFQREEILDMRYNPENILTAETIVNQWSQQEIEEILKKFGQERFAKRIARKIGEERNRRFIQTTFQLIEIIKKAIPSRYRKGRIHFATRTFQALRIAVNGELENLEMALPQATEILETGGRIVVISFHSLEDRIVKNFFREQNKKKLLKILTKKPIVPTKEEIKQNRRSRSAKLRAAVKLV